MFIWTCVVVVARVESEAMGNKLLDRWRHVIACVVCDLEMVIKESSWTKFAFGCNGRHFRVVLATILHTNLQIKMATTCSLYGAKWQRVQPENVSHCIAAATFFKKADEGENLHFQHTNTESP